MSKVIKPLKDKELTDILFRLGPRKLIFVEGETDQEIMEDIWFIELMDQIMFHHVHGNTRVEEYIQRMGEINKQSYGIIDRDFKSDNEIGVHESLLVLSLFTLENYLLSPIILHEELKIAKGKDNLPIKSEEEMIKTVIEICKTLIPITAANWIIWEEKKGRESYFDEGFDGANEALMIGQLSKKLGLPEDIVRERLKLTIEHLNKLMESWESAYTKINGKYILIRIYKDFRPSIDKNYFYRLLARTIKSRNLINKEIENFIVDITKAH